MTIFQEKLYKHISIEKTHTEKTYIWHYIFHDHDL